MIRGNLKTEISHFCQYIKTVFLDIDNRKKLSFDYVLETFATNNNQEK